MTPTEKRYAKNVGKLFVFKEKRFNMERREFEYEYGLCMVYGMIRTGYSGKTGAYAYQINTLAPVVQDWRKDYNLRCTEFIGKYRHSHWGSNRTYELLTKENMELVGKVIDEKKGE